MVLEEGVEKDQLAEDKEVIDSEESENSQIR
jgi:hypothetical protein